VAGNKRYDFRIVEASLLVNMERDMAIPVKPPCEITVQHESDAFAALFNYYKAKCYNPRHVPAIPYEIAWFPPDDVLIYDPIVNKVYILATETFGALSIYESRKQQWEDAERNHNWVENFHRNLEAHRKGAVFDVPIWCYVVILAAYMFVLALVIGVPNPWPH
jgi:hypothetical protein